MSAPPPPPALFGAESRIWSRAPRILESQEREQEGGRTGVPKVSSREKVESKSIIVSEFKLNLDSTLAPAHHLLNMAAARRALKIGMIPADGIGREVLPVSIRHGKCAIVVPVAYRNACRPLNVSSKLLVRAFPSQNSFRFSLDGMSSPRQARHCPRRPSGELSALCLTLSKADGFDLV